MVGVPSVTVACVWLEVPFENWLHKFEDIVIEYTNGVLNAMVKVPVELDPAYPATVCGVVVLLVTYVA